MDAGRLVAIATAYTAALFYALTLALRRTRYARALWTTALAAYLIHVVAAFHSFYDWSHAIAWRETAKQTAALFGTFNGDGIYLNYLFTLVWIADCAWWHRNPHAYENRPRAITATVQAFMAFMFINAVIVFGKNPLRWIGLAVAIILVAERLTARSSRAGLRPHQGRASTGDDGQLH